VKLYDALQSRALRRSATAAACLALASGAASAFLFYRVVAVPSATVALIAFVLGAMAGATPAAAAGILLHAIEENRRQADALTAIRPLMGDLPLPLGRWACDAHFAALIVRTIADSRPSLVVECGSGSSTVLAAETLRRLGSGHILSFEHDAAFADATRRMLAHRGLNPFATVLTTPIAPRLVDGETRPWYADSADARVDASIDLLIVDGPPRHLHSLARFPAIPLLGHHLAPACTILMDDGNRPDESRIALLWARRLHAAVSFVRGGKGAWILRPRTPPPEAS